MFKSLGADLMGTSDNCTPIRRDDLQAAGDILSYLLPREKPWIILKSKIKEFVFTDHALIFIERDNIAGTRRVINRYNYIDCKFSDVRFETPGKKHDSLYKY
jgi:hypothetical protein